MIICLHLDYIVLEEILSMITTIAQLYLIKIMMITSIL